MENNHQTFKRIYKKSAAEKIQEVLGIMICAAVTIIIVAGIIGIDLL